jgi:hypothetical protein
MNNKTQEILDLEDDLTTVIESHSVDLMLGDVFLHIFRFATYKLMQANPELCWNIITEGVRDGIEDELKERMGFKYEI